MGEPAGTSSPQKVVCWTFVVEVGEVKKNPLTVTGEAVKAVLVPAKVKLEVEYLWLEVAMELEPLVRVELAESCNVVLEFPALVPVAFWLVLPVVLDAKRVP